MIDEDNQKFIDMVNRGEEVPHHNPYKKDDDLIK